MSLYKVLDKKNKDVMDYKSSINFLKCEDKSTCVFLLVSHVDNKKNDMARISCKNMSYIVGYPCSSTLKPLNGGYVYDCVSDSYVISCIDFIALGLIPFYFKLKLNNVGAWESLIPIPEKILNRSFDKLQKDNLESFRQMYPTEQFVLNFLQFLVE